MLTYTFHVSLPGFGRLWRKLELPADATLETLHLAIQDAYNFDHDHLYSFFMSGKAWDSESEYTIYEDDLDWGVPLFFDGVNEEEEEEEDDDGEEEDRGAPDKRATGTSALPNFVALAEVPPSDITEAPEEPAEQPTPQQLREMFAQLKDDPDAREALMKNMSEQLGLPPLMAQMLLGNLDAFISNVSDEELDEVLNLDMTALFDGDEDDEEEEEGDVRATTLAALDLKKGQKFLYLFDYGDEWRFDVKVHAVNPAADPNATYPRLVESVGEAPPQYPAWDEDDEWDEDNESDR